MIGTMIGSYKIEQKIGEGGMGAVYRGQDLMLEREVAIKVLRPELARQPELVARFRTEAVTLAKLNHSNIATLYNFMRHGDDFFMMMEFVRGRTLEEIIRQGGAMEVERAVRIFCQALEGIAHAHSSGVIHRDIKPANLMITANGEVKVMDFGIARVLGTARQTKTGRLIGTLEYMSPEQMRGQETDDRSDIYSLGILLYEMLTGRVPFECDSDYQLMRAQVEDEPPSPREFKGDLPLPVELAIMRSLAKDPGARFQSAVDFRCALISAVPAAAIKPLPVKPPVNQESQIKATRQASGLLDHNVSFENQVKQAPIPQPAEVHMGGSRFSRLNWKHYATAAAAVLMIGLGLFTLRGSTGKPEAPKQEKISIQPENIRVPAATPPVIEPATVVLPDPASSVAEQPVKRTETGRRTVTNTQPARRQEVTNYRPVRAPTPAPTPAQTAQSQKAEKKEKKGKKDKKSGFFGELGDAAKDGVREGIREGLGGLFGGEKKKKN